MRRLLVLGLLLAVVPAASGASVRSVTAPAPVTALAADGLRVAYATGFSARDCNRVYVWDLAARGIRRLGRRTHCEQTSTGNAIAGLSIAGSRVLWVHYAGGNLRDWTLWTATTLNPTPRKLRERTTEADADAPIVVGPGDSSRAGDILPYAVEREVIALRANGSRRFAWTAPARVTALAALGGELAVATEGGRVTVLDGAGRELRRVSFPADVAAIRLTGSAVLAQYGRTLQRGGDTWALPPGARLEDAGPTSALYVAGGTVRELLLAAGEHAERSRGAGTHVQVEGSALSISSGRRVTLRDTR
jgi:hypothetical protein